ncbi:MAG: hypothetical protein HYY10_03930 [Candidatus Liptonbacteria bacterium]|nr:hypothetical protein [Candidatus Liptonbacteria bacterium]
MARRIKNWLIDYLHAFRAHSYAFFVKPPTHYLGYVNTEKAPVILIPGIYEKWHFLKAIADPLSLKGHPIYILEHLGYNTKGIHHTAKLIRELIDEKNLRNVILVAHSKGGLIGKYLLAFHNKDGRIKKLFAIATPFGGSRIVKLIPRAIAKRLLLLEFAPANKLIKDLRSEKEVNCMIVSIYGASDNHIWPEASCKLEGATNIQINVHGHHKILFDKKLRGILQSMIGKT